MDVVWRIIQGYAQTEDETNVEAVAQILAMHRTRISGVSGFLTDLGIISGGQKKRVTEPGRRLGRALQFEQLEEARAVCRALVRENEFVSGLVTTVRLRSGMSVDALAKHVLMVSGAKKTKENETGARALIEFLEFSGFVVREDGNLNVTKESLDGRQSHVGDGDYEQAQAASPEDPAVDLPTPRTSPPPDIRSSTPPLTINIELHIPATDNAEVYDNLFRALRQHLMSDES